MQNYEENIQLPIDRVGITLITSENERLKSS